MTMESWPAGLLTALVTPLREDRLDLDGLATLVDRQARAGVGAVVIAGGTGEFGVLSTDERKELAAEAVRAAAGHIPVVVQTGALSTREALDLSTHAESVGADALMVASPFGEPISWRERVHFYEVLTRAVTVPVIVYNTPPSGLLTMDQVKELAGIPGIRALKDSSGDSTFMGDLVAWAPPGFGLYIGLDSLLYDAIATGARGALFGTGNLIPEVLTAIVASVRAHGPTPASRALWSGQVRPFLRFVEQSPNYVALVKAGLGVLGLPGGAVREPFLMPDADEVGALARLLEGVAKAHAESDL